MPLTAFLLRVISFISIKDGIQCTLLWLMFVIPMVVLATNHTSNGDPNNLAGKTINLFSHYGFLALTIKLLEAYFDHFVVDGISAPHKPFLSSMAPSIMGRHLSLNKSHVAGEYAFVLVRLIRQDEHVALQAGELKTSPFFKTIYSSLPKGLKSYAHAFFDLFGTHLIQKYTTGNLLFQVFVVKPQVLNELRKVFLIQTGEARTSGELMKHLKPSSVIHMGNVRIASEHPENARIIPEKTIIFNVLQDPSIEEKLNSIRGKVILSLKLVRITQMLQESPIKHWLMEVLDNTLALVNLTM